MIDWFSAQYARGDIELITKFDRTKINKYWAYKPKESPTDPNPLEGTIDRKSEPTEDEDMDLDSAIQTTFGLERDLQAALRGNLEQLEPGLHMIDGEKERRTEAGWVDITAEDKDGAIVIIELKAGTADEKAIAQILSYMGAMASNHQKPVRGILVAGDFTRRTTMAARMVPNLELRKYAFKFKFEAVA